MLFVGVDWAEDHHDVCVMHEAGTVLDKRRVAHSVRGIGEIHELVAEFSEEEEPIAVGIEVDRGLLVSALVGAGYEVYAVNPLAASRYRERHGVSGAKSDPGDAKMLADLVRTDRHNHRVLGGDSELVDAIRVLARSHQSAIWSRQRQVNALRSALREFYPAALEAFGSDLGSSDALAVLAIAPTPELAVTLSRSKIASALRRGGAPAQSRDPGRSHPGHPARSVPGRRPGAERRLRDRHQVERRGHRGPQPRGRGPRESPGRAF